MSYNSLLNVKALSTRIVRTDGSFAAQQTTHLQHAVEVMQAPADVRYCSPLFWKTGILFVIMYTSVYFHFRYCFVTRDIFQILYFLLLTDNLDPRGHARTRHYLGHDQATHLEQGIGDHYGNMKHIVPYFLASVHFGLWFKRKHNRSFLC